MHAIRDILLIIVTVHNSLSWYEYLNSSYISNKKPVFRYTEFPNQISDWMNVKPLLTWCGFCSLYTRFLLLSPLGFPVIVEFELLRLNVGLLEDYLVKSSILIWICVKLIYIWSRVVNYACCMWLLDTIHVAKILAMRVYVLNIRVIRISEFRSSLWMCFCVLYSLWCLLAW